MTGFTSIIFARPRQKSAALTFAIVLSTLVLAALTGMSASPTSLVMVASPLLLMIIFVHPSLGLPALVLTTLLFRAEIGTGTDVRLNASFIFAFVLICLWFLRSLLHNQTQSVRSTVFLPLSLFVLSGFLSLLVGNAWWEPSVPRNGNLLLVQLAQWAIVTASAGIFWLAAVIPAKVADLRRLTFLFVFLGGILVSLRLIPDVSPNILGFSTTYFVWPASLMLLSALSGGQLLYNRNLSRELNGLLVAVLGVAVYYSLVLRREDTSAWIGVVVVLVVLAWLRFPKYRWALLVGSVFMLTIGNLFSSLYEYAGGDAEWFASGGSRLVLIERVIEVTMHNPITGLGPAAYRSYAAMEPLIYGGAFWMNPATNSHNNYVDLFAHVGLFGLILFGWIVIAFTRMGLHLRQYYENGFEAGYVNGLLAAGVGSLILMLFADWILPHVYNIGFDGFQASIMVWLFLGGVVALENMATISMRSDVS